MKLIPAFTVLEDLGPLTPASVIGGLDHEASMYAQLHATSKQVSDERVREAREEGYKAGYAAAATEAEVRLKMQEEDVGKELERQHSEWKEDIGHQLALDLASAVNLIRDEISKQTSLVLLPFVSKQICNKAVTDLVEQVIDITEGGIGAQIKVFGPSELIAQFQMSVPDQLDIAVSERADTAEITANIDNTVIQTRISQWAARLQGAIS